MIRKQSFMLRIRLLLAAATLILSACSSPSAQPAGGNPPPAQAVAEPTLTSGAAPPAAGPTAAPEPTAAAPLPDPVPLEVVAQGIGPSGHYGFLVRNPNPAHAIQNSTFTATAYDASGNVIGTGRMANLEMVLPGQTLGVGDSIWVEDVEPASVSVALTSGEPVVATEALPPYSITNSSICTAMGFTGVRAEINSPFATDVLLPRISVLYYDAAGKIIGSASGYRSGFAAGSTNGVVVWGGNPVGMDHYEVYPGYRGIPSTTSPIPADAQPLKVTASGYAVDGDRLTYGVIVENPNAGYVVDEAVLAVNVYAADGKFLRGSSWMLVSLQPGQRIGISEQLVLCDGDVADHIEVAIGAGTFTAGQPITYFTSENVALQDGAVSGELVNQSGMDFKVIYAMAIVYDAAGNIIGAGSQTLEAVAAGARTSVQVPVAVNGTPARAELFGVLISPPQR